MLAKKPSRVISNIIWWRKKLCKAIDNHHYFHEVWCFSGTEQKRRVLDIIADGKGIISYEKIVDINSPTLTPENGNFLEKTEFYSDLKKKAVSNNEYESLLYVFKTQNEEYRWFEPPLQCPRQCPRLNFTLWNNWKPISIHVWIMRFQSYKV